MPTVTYKGDDLDLEVTLRRPTVRDNLLAAILTRKMDEAKASGQIIPELVLHAAYFVICITCLADSKGLALTIPDLTTSTDDILQAFGRWLMLPDIDFVTPWYNAALSIRKPDDPKAMRSEKKAQPRSAKQRKK